MAALSRVFLFFSSGYVGRSPEIILSGYIDMKITFKMAKYANFEVFLAANLLGILNLLKIIDHLRAKKTIKTK